MKDRLAATDAALEAERAAHAGTRRALSEALAAHQALQTRFGHTELSHGEALKAERDARRTAEEALAAIRAEAESREPSPAPSARAVRMPRATKPARSAAPAREEKPVRWWTPSYRAKKS